MIAELAERTGQSADASRWALLRDGIVTAGLYHLYRCRPHFIGDKTNRIRRYLPMRIKMPAASATISMRKTAGPSCKPKPKRPWRIK